MDLTVKMICLSALALCLLQPANGVENPPSPKTEVTSCSQPSMFRCEPNENVCVEESLVCNGVSECRNGRDESVAICGCLPQEFQCNATICIDKIKRCNRVEDCMDGLDEIGCETFMCPDTHSKCSNHFCIPNEAVCNYVDDCGDNSDEDKCEYRTCYSTEFECRDFRCIPNGELCDGEPNCSDGSDEDNCDIHFRCENGLYVNGSRKCDGWPDCYESHADESYCGTCLEDEFLCNNGRCIRNSNVCDGVCDCIYTCEDEKECETFACPIKEKFICKNTFRCIEKAYLCDGKNDCWNTFHGADEYFCYTNKSECAKKLGFAEVFYCPEGRCLPASGPENVLCDHYADCLNGEDEMGCEYKPCNSSQFRCDNGQCIAWEKRCDSNRDCYDRSDEVGCADHSCPYNTVRCRSGQCVPEEYWCDFVGDCPDFSDEQDCVRRKCKPDEFRCTNGQCIDKQFECFNGKMIGRNGCADGSHLMNCRNFNCTEGRYKCHLSYCIEQMEVCDGVIDCKMRYSDEENCRHKCPSAKDVCECYDMSLICEDKGLTKLPYGLSQEKLSIFYLSGNQLNVTEDTFRVYTTLTLLDLSDNGITSLPIGSFRSQWRLLTLKLENNEIPNIENGTFLGLNSLRTLVLGGNKIREIAPQGFLGLYDLHALNLSYQSLVQLSQNTFIGLRNTMTLNLSHNAISSVPEGTFNGLIRLLSLDLSYNQIRHVEENVFHGLKSLTFLDISKNEIQIIEEHVFTGLLNLHDLVTDEFRFCCAAKVTGRCLPEPDEFSSCTDLMSNYVLKVFIWILGLVAFWGNLLVVVWRTCDLRNGKVHSFLITNLAIGDFFMGVYMMIIAVADSHYRGKYILYDKFWRESDFCKFAGFVSTFSSELSVFTLTVITLDRLICIIFPLKLKRLGLKEACIVMISVWIVVLAISGIPLTGLDYFENFYGRSGVCLAFHITNSKPKGWEYSVMVFLVLNFVSFLVIFFSYLWMFFVAKQTRRAVRKTEAKSDASMAKRMTVIVMTDFCCWVPIILLGFASLGGAMVPPQVYAWVAVFILPLNSAINPVLYTLSTAPFLRNFRKRASTFRKSFTGSVKTDTKQSFLDERSSHMWDRKPIYRQMELMRMKSYNNKTYSCSHSSTQQTSSHT